MSSKRKEKKAKKKAKTSGKESATVSSGRVFKVLIYDGSPAHDWLRLFGDRRLADGSRIEIVQCSWIESRVFTEAVPGQRAQCYVSCAPIRESTGKYTRQQTMTFVPDFVVVRNQPRGPSPGTNRLENLYGLMMAGLPSINSLSSIYMDLERPLMYAALKEIELRVGHEAFPLIPQTYYSHPSEIAVFSDWPCVAKVSHAHAGQGKMLLRDTGQLQDLASVLLLNESYCTLEPFIQVSHGIRVQKIGPSVSVMRKEMTGSGWKSQFGGAHLSLIEPTPQYLLWVDECSKCFGGLDIFAVDAVVDKNTGKHWIIELNGTAIGLLHQPEGYWEEHSRHIVDLAVAKMNDLFVKPAASVAASSSNS